MFSTHPKTYFNFLITFILPSANALNLDQSKILSLGKELILVTELILVMEASNCQDRNVNQTLQETDISPM